MSRTKTFSIRQMEDDPNFWIEFIKTCEKYPVLWAQNYRAELKAYDELLPMLKQKDRDADDTSVKKYCTKFKKELVEDLNRNAVGKRPRTFYFRHLKFLEPYVIHHKARSTNEDIPTDEMRSMSDSKQRNQSLERGHIQTQNEYLEMENAHLRNVIATIAKLIIESKMPRCP